MAYTYFTKQLIEKSNEIDLTNIFPDKQQRAKEILNTNYSLPQIVEWIKDSTNNFKVSDGYFIDLDLAIKRLINRYYESTNQQSPFINVSDKSIDGSKQPRKPVEVSASGVKSGQSDIKVAVDKVGAVEDEIISLKEAIEYLKDEAEAGDTDALEALEYLKEELESLSKGI